MIKLPLNLLFLFIISVALVMCTWFSAQWVAVLMASMDSPLIVVSLFASVIVVPLVVYVSCMVLYVWYTTIIHFLVDVRRDAFVDFDNGLPL